MIYHLLLPSFMFIFGVFGIFLSRKNVILILIFLELLLLSINYHLVYFSIHLDDLLGQFFSLFCITIAASETAIGLALLICYSRCYKY